MGASPLTLLRLGLTLGLAAGLGGLFDGRRRRRRAPVRESSAAERVEQQGRWLGALVEQAGEAAIALSPQGRILSWNRGAERMLGYRAEEVVGTHVELLAPERLRVEEQARVAGALGRGESVHLETVRRRKDGGEVPVALVASPLVAGDGRVVGSVTLLSDLSERKRQQALLREASERFESAFGAAAIGMALVGPDGRFLQVNGALCELTGYRERELLEKTFVDITHPDDRELGLAELRELRVGARGSFQLEKRYLRADGEPVGVCCRCRPCAASGASSAIRSPSCRT